MTISIDELLLRVQNETPFTLSGVNGALVLVCRLDGRKEYVQLPPEDADRILMLAVQQITGRRYVPPDTLRLLPKPHVPGCIVPNCPGCSDGDPVSADEAELQELLQLAREAPVPEPNLDCSCARCGAPAARQTLLCVVHERHESEAVLAEDAKEQERLYEEELRQGESEGGYDPGYEPGGPW